MTLLKIEHLAKSYNGVPALKDVSLTVEAGEAHALLGENGAGKSTLIKILAGVIRQDNGAIHVDGAVKRFSSPREAHAAGLRFVHQELNSVAQISVAENIFLGRPCPSRFGLFVDWRGLNRAAESALRALDLHHLRPDQIMARLSAGDQMLVKIAASFASGKDDAPRLYVMDEPTAALSGKEASKLFEVISMLRVQGCGVIYVSNRLDEARENCQYITILRDGESVTTVPAGEVSPPLLTELMTGREALETYPPRMGKAAQEIAFQFAIAGKTGGRASKIILRKGEVLGVAGLVGAGQTGLLRAIMGAGGGKPGSLLKNGRRLSIKGPSKAWASGMAYVPGERRGEGLILGHSIQFNTVLPYLNKINRLGFLLDRKTEKACAKATAKQVRLTSVGPKHPVWRLSGGDQQKVMFARAVAGRPDLLVLEEPTRGVDVGAKFDIHLLLRELAQSGVSIIIASSDHAELLGMSDRILVMRDGEISDDVATDELTPHLLMSLCDGGDPPSTEKLPTVQASTH